MNSVSYVIEVFAIQLLFIALYHIYLKKTTFFTWNRYYLIGSSIIAYVLPLVKIASLRSESVLFGTYELNEILLSSKNIAATVPEQVLSLAWYIYLIGVSISSVLFLYKLYTIFRIYNTGNRFQKMGYTFIQTKLHTKAFSFLHYIFIDTSVSVQKDTEIITHEIKHCKQYHSIDLIWFELQKILFWWNPMVYLYQKNIQLVHEYLSDQEVLLTMNRKKYFNRLVEDIFYVDNYSFVNQFNAKNHLKQRIMMATKEKSRQVSRMNYLLVIPAILSVILYASCTEDDSEQEIITEQISELNSAIEDEYGDIIMEHYEKSNDNIAFTELDQVPIFPGCENSIDKKTCFEQAVRNHVTKEFKTDIANSLGLGTGRKKIITVFKVGNDGKIIDVKSRAPHPKLKEEAIRVITSLPEMIPGFKNSKSAIVPYMVPITIVVE